MKIIIGNNSHRGIKGFIAAVIVMTLAIIIAARIMPSVTMSNIGVAMLTGITICLLNRFLRPVLVFLTLPFTAITMGLFLFIINAAIIMLTSAIVPGFRVEGFGSALVFGFLLTVLNFLLELPNRVSRQRQEEGEGQEEMYRINDSNDDHFDTYEEVRDDQ